MKERQSSVGDVVNELSIIREQLKHPNIVRYYRTFIIGKLTARHIDETVYRCPLHFS